MKISIDRLGKKVKQKFTQRIRKILSTLYNKRSMIYETLHDDVLSNCVAVQEWDLLSMKIF